MKVIGFIFIFLFLINNVIAQTYSPCSGFGMMSYWPYGGWNMLLWIIIILIIAYFLVKYLKDGNLNLDSDSLEILKRRYAKGEITKKQFEQMKKELR